MLEEDPPAGSIRETKAPSKQVSSPSKESGEVSSHLEVGGLSVGSLDRPMPRRRARVALDHGRHKVVADRLLHAAFVRTLRIWQAAVSES